MADKRYDYYPTRGERKAKLRALKRVLQRYQDRIATAVSADFGGRSATETKLVEVLGPVLEINHALHSVGRWMKPRRRRTELMFKTISVWVSYQPKGVVGIITPWNFPLYLALGPLVAALAAGNRATIKMSEFSPRTTDLLAQMVAEARKGRPLMYPPLPSAAVMPAAQVAFDIPRTIAKLVDLAEHVAGQGAPEAQKLRPSRVRSDNAIHTSKALA